MAVQLPRDHHCPWRELAESMERRFGEIIARQQRIIEEQAKLIEEQAAKLRAYEAGTDARVLALEAEVARLERDLIGRKSEKLKVRPHERDLGEEPSEEEKARRREEAEKKRRERALARDAALATEGVDHPIPDAMKSCATCGGTEHDELPPEESTRIDYVPGRFVRRRHRRQKIVLKCRCPGTSIVVAPAPPAPIAGGLYDAGFIAYLVVAKCADAIPIHRLERRFARVGVPISRSTMNDLVLAAAEKLRPLFTRIQTRMADVQIVLADETSMRLQDRSKRGFVWVFHGVDDRSGGELALYVFALDRSGETPSKVLGASQGTLVCDGYTGYNDVTDPDGRARGGCMCHARRKFFEARASAPAEADHVLTQMRQLFRVEHEATSRGIAGTPEHLALRRARSQPVLDGLYDWIAAHKPRVLPKSPIGTAMQYMLNQRERLELFLRDARVPLHNNASERRLRIIALLRKNALFFGHPRAGRLFAVLYSLVGTCIANDVEPTAYLSDVLARVRDDMTDADLDALLPDRWSPPSRTAQSPS
jgi:transposase